MRRRLAVWLVAGSVLLTALVLLVGCTVTSSFTPTPQPAHPSTQAGQSCTSGSDCHAATHTHKQPYQGACENCHNLKSWTQVTYTHKDPAFNEGTHPLVGCPMCHTEGEALPSPECKTCHDAPHGGWNGCSNCHMTVAWRLVRPLPAGHLSLKGGHAKLICQDCHKNPAEPAKSRTCTNCHGTNHGGLTTCQDCHTPDLGWQKPRSDFDHNEFFVRVGVHAKLACGKCHPNDRFAGTPRACVGCHGVHHGGLTQCGQCHTPTASKGFKYTTFVHSKVFRLTGVHLSVFNAGKCSQCHPHSQYAKVAGTSCIDCHSSGNPNTTPPGSPHRSSVPSRCQTCHTPSGFDFAHLLKPYSAHPVDMSGRHAQMACTLCHTSLVFSSPTKSCVTCHSAGGTEPAGVPHVGPSTCLDCHTPTTWSNTHFTHPLIIGIGMISPHTPTEWGSYPTGCVKCHPSSGSNPDFTRNSCSGSGCHG